MKTLQKVCLVLILTTIVNLDVSAQDQKDVPDKDRRPGVKVEKDKNDDKPDDSKNRDDNNKDKDKRDKGNKKPPGMR